MAKNLTKAIAAALVVTMGTTAFAQQKLSVKTDRSKMNASAVSLKPQSPSTMLLMSSKGNLADTKSEANKPAKAPFTGPVASAPSREEASDTYYNDFDNPDSFLIFDENGDGITWQFGDKDGNGNAGIGYNSSQAMNDWLITEGVELIGGKAYEFSIDFWCNGYTEKVEIMIGSTRTPAGMTITALPVVTTNSSTPTTFSATVVPPTTGTYYIGVHGCSAADQYNMYVDNLKVGAPQSAEMPDKVTDLVAYQKDGTEDTAIVSCKAPMTRFNGTALAGLTKMELLRNNIVISSIANPSPGQVMQIEDICGAGKFTWTAIAYNEDGASVPVSVDAAVVGTAEVPYRKDFPTEDSMDEMTIIDADGDGATWTWNKYQKYAELSTSGQSSDDWLLSIPINLKAGKLYEFSSLVSAGNPEAFTPQIAIYVGNAPTVEAMTTTILPTTEITKFDTYFDEEFSVPEDGKYWIGVHGCSKAWLALIKLMWFEVKGGAEMNGPAAPMEVVMNPDWSGRTTTMDISFVAPVTTNAGEALTSLTKIEIQRSGTVIKTFENPTPGTEYSYTDVAPESGTYVYAIVPYNEVGMGRKVDMTVDLGKAGKSIPYKEGFTSEVAYEEEYTFIDANEDGTNFWHATQTNPPYIWIHYGDSAPTNDDYAITPAIALEENTVYEFSVDAWGYQEVMELLAGSAPTIEGLSEVVLEPTNLTGSMATYKGTFTSTYAGNYFFGIHAVSQDRIDTFYATNVSITKVGALAGPAAVTDLKFVPTETGFDISFNAPTKTVAGEPLSEISSIEVLRDNQSIKTFENPAPGAALTLTDEVDEDWYIYDIVPVLNDVEGQTVSQYVIFGEDVPAQPQNVVAEYVGDGKVKITWDPVTTTAHGVYAPADGYILLQVDSYGKQTQIGSTGECEYTYDAIDPEDQAMFNYGVFPAYATSDQVGEYGYSNAVYAGTPYKMSYRESFADGSFASVINITPLIFDGAWYLCTNETFNDVGPSDGDNGFIAMKGAMGTTARLETGMIDLATNAISPTLSFNVYVINPEEYDNELYVDVCEVGTDNWTEVAGGKIADLNSVAGWTRVQVDLAAYKGKNIMVALRPVGRTYLYTIMDAIRVSNLTDNDLGINMTCATTDVIAGENVALEVTVANNGQKDAGEASIELWKNDEFVTSRKVSKIASGSTKAARFNLTLDITDEDNVTFYTKIVYEGDENLNDNTSKTIELNVVKPIYPAAQNLTASADKSDVTLNWDAPSMASVAPSPKTEDFETAPSWNQEGANGWTFVDLDGAPTGGFEGFGFPGMTNSETVVPFFVIDMDEPTLNTEAGNYGPNFYGNNNSVKSIGALLTWTGAACDDWAISPELYGGRQTVSLFVRALLESNPETFQGYYSTGSTDPADFIALGKPMSYNGDWTEVSFYLPNGAKRFAIRHMSTSGALLMVDDITFRPAGAEPENLTLVGYNVYCDGERVNGAPVEETTFTTTNPVDGKHNYAVSAVYEQGESDTVRADVQVSEINGVTDATLSVIGSKGSVVIRGAEGLEVTVAAADGKVIFAGEGENYMQIAAEAGVSVVKAGNRTFKVVVK